MADPFAERLVSPAEVLARLEPGMSIFLGTGSAEPLGLVRQLMATEAANLQDLELVQLVSFADAISYRALSQQKYRLRTFFSGWVASDEIGTGRVDLIPSRFARIPRLIQEGRLRIDAAFLQISPPDPAGYCSLGLSADVARAALEKASLVVGEVNPHVPLTYGDTFVSADEFHFLVRGTEPPITFPRWPVDPIFDQVAANVASVIGDGACLSFSIGPIFEALGRHLVRRRNLGVHSPFFTDALMDLVRSGAVSNRNKEIFRGKSVATYALGTAALYRWLDRNPLVEFQSIDKVFHPVQVGRNRQHVTVLPARKVDLSGRIALHVGKGLVAASPGEALDFINGAELSEGGRTVCALPSRNQDGLPNLWLSVESLPNQLTLRESVDMVVTEYGVATLRGRSVRERAQALIDVAHPDDRPGLVARAKEENILYADQIFLPETAHFYPADVETRVTLPSGLAVRFRAIKPSDEEEMRRLFYRFSNQTVYYRYFSPIKAMPHARMQEYVNVDYRQVMSLVGLVGDPGQEHLVAEGRYARAAGRPFADLAFVVDEAYQGRGIASELLRLLVRLARVRGVQGFTADVLATNKGMMKVIEKVGLPVKACLEQGVYGLTIFFDPPGAPRPA